MTPKEHLKEIKEKLRRAEETGNSTLAGFYSRKLHELEELYREFLKNEEK